MMDSSLLAVLSLGGPVMPTHRASTPTGVGTAASSHTVNMPTYQDGDLLLWMAAQANATPNPATPSGWTLVTAKTNLSYTFTSEFGTETATLGAFTLYSRVVPSGSSFTTQTLTYSGGSTQAAHCVIAISGESPTSPINASDAEIRSGAASSTIPVGNVTTTTPETLGVLFAVYNGSSSSVTWPASWTQRAAAVGGSARCAVATLEFPGVAGVKDPANASAAGSTTAASWLGAIAG